VVCHVCTEWKKGRLQRLDGMGLINLPFSSIPTAPTNLLFFSVTYHIFLPSC
jgi:hypothetical protein